MSIFTFVAVILLALWLAGLGSVTGAMVLAAFGASFVWFWIKVIILMIAS